MSNQEVIVNLWYVRDEEGIIYSLRAKAYVVEGSDEEKLAFLKEQAMHDYLIAEPFEVPQRLHLTIGSGQNAKKMPVGHISMIDALDSPIALFEDAIKALENRFPVQSHLSIPQDPMVCTTPLMMDKDGLIKPHVSHQLQF